MDLVRRVKRAWMHHILSKNKVSYALWQTAILASPTLACLSRSEKHRLRKLASLFLLKKTITFVAGFEEDPSKRVYIAAQACLLILNLDLSCFNGWNEVIVYPTSFIVNRDEYDKNGVVHKKKQVLAGESWRRGPVVLSWSDADPRTANHSPGANVVLHEFAHKLDTLNGPADGYPPLQSGMKIEAWTKVLSTAFSKLNYKLDHNKPTFINPYAALNPAEFFAVLTEVFFEQPVQQQRLFPEVYGQFCLYYRQDPVLRSKQSSLS
jgi:Mlc titration factor MtfA (ptsG expression regulator)